MVSDIICLHIYDRIFVLSTTFYALAVHQCSVRGYYSKMYGITSDESNDVLLVLGMISAFSLPLIGIFDEHWNFTVHCIVAGFFFFSVGIYAIKLALSMHKHKS